MMIYAGVAIDRRIPLRVIMYAAVASLAGSAAAVQVATASEFISPVFIGTLAGLFAGTIMAIIMMAYDLNPRPPKELPPNP
jgi:ABC-type enterobactin transport system permease subunit